ncbi:hypothetical protein EHS25_009182 [Saitozyma podzolica]|uniref:GATA-type domain-containing protein n=1 Tax=Saitozyma podzolica TaxID=1890683 RepID=A0A427YL24_9TREE|nr:hypothetical protein EHS25_009182 [Saitozyma podzolica]
MEPTIEQSLSQVIEPLLAPSHHDDAVDVSESQIDPALADHPGVNVNGDVELEIEVDARAGAGADADAKPTPLRAKGKRTRIVPGSEADFRRKEANRLAAERSRIRAHEKAAGLEVAARSLEEENARLKEELARLEAEVGGGVGVQSQTETDGHATVTTTHTGNGVAVQQSQSQSQSESDFQSQPQPQTISVDDPGSDAATQAQNDVHSRNILAALMSDAGIAGVEEGDEATWMQGVENFIKEAESSGRLGELAAVAAGQNDGEGEGNAGAEGEGADAQGGVSEDQAEEGDQSSSVPMQLEADTSSPSKPRVLGFTLAGAAQATASAIAVALNTEMERILRDDLAATKAAIARLEREIAHVRDSIPSAGGPPVGGIDVSSDEPSRPSSLPADVLDNDADAIRASSDTAQESIKRLEDELPELRNTVATMRDEKVKEETKMAEVIDELFVLGVDGGAQHNKQKEEVDSLLKAIGGYVGSLINGGQPNNDSRTAFTPSFSSPALARRRRGRPPKGSQPLSYAQNLLYSLSPARSSLGNSNAAPEPPSPVTPKPKARRGRPPRKSRLSKAVDVANDTAAAAETVEIAEAVEVAQEDEPTSSSRTMEEAILSHLQQHVSARGADGDEIHLDPASFAELLPSHLETQFGSAAADEQNQGQKRTSDQEQQSLGTAQEGQEVGEEAEASAMAIMDAVSSVAESPSVLSRLRKGPPGSCDLCWRTETPSWRKLHLGGETYKVCNPCGVYWRKCKVLRPPELWGDGKTIKKRKAGARASNAADTDDTPTKRKKLEMDPEQDAQDVGDMDLTADFIDPALSSQVGLGVGQDGEDGVQVELVEEAPAHEQDQEQQQQQLLEQEQGVGHDHDNDHDNDHEDLGLDATLPEEMHLEGDSLRSVFGV